MQRGIRYQIYGEYTFTYVKSTLLFWSSNSLSFMKMTSDVSPGRMGVIRNFRKVSRTRYYSCYSNWWVKRRLDWALLVHCMHIKWSPYMLQLLTPPVVISLYAHSVKRMTGCAKNLQWSWCVMTSLRPYLYITVAPMSFVNGTSLKYSATLPVSFESWLQTSETFCSCLARMKTWYERQSLDW